MPKVTEMYSAIKKHMAVMFTLSMILVGILTCFIPFDAINVHYRAVFGDSVDAATRVVFVFDHNKDFPESSEQPTLVSNGIADIRLDPLNFSSQSLTMDVKSPNVDLHRLSAVVSINGRDLYEISSIDTALMERSQSDNGDRTLFSVNAVALKTLQYQTRMKSEIKIPVLAVLLLIYLIVISRMTVCRRVDRRYYISAVAAMLCIGGFLINLWVTKPAVEQNTPFTYTQTSDIDTTSDYTIRQPFLIKGDHAGYLRLPITLTNKIQPTDTTNTNYSTVYENPKQFRDTYVLTLIDNINRRIFDGPIVPDMLDDGLQYVQIPLNINQSAGEQFTLILRHVASENNAPVVLRFQNGSIEQPDGTILNPMTSKDVLPNGYYLNFSVGYNGFPYRTAITIIVCLAVFLLTLAIVTICAIRRYKRFGSLFAYTFCGVNYLILGMYVCWQRQVYVKYIQGFADEPAHISYIAFIRQQKSIVPDFASMGIYNISGNAIDMSTRQQFNYLGHPPLYYLIMALLGDFHIAGQTVTVDINWLRKLSFLIGLAAILLMFYIGFTRLPKHPLTQMVFGLMIISPPNLVYGISGVSNDTLLMLTVTIFLFGLIRFYERKTDFWTYLLIAVGVASTLMTKLTGGMIVSILALFVVIYTLLREHDLKRVFNIRFYTTLPLYAIPFAYFALLITRFHSLQPSYQSLAYSEYIRSGMYYDIQRRQAMGVWEYVSYFLKNFANTWYTLAGHTYVPRPSGSFYSIDRVALMLILVVPLLLFFVKKKNTACIYLIFGYTSLLITFIYQLFASGFKSFQVNGYNGAFSSRYYICAILIFALSFIYLFLSRYCNYRKYIYSNQRFDHCGGTTEACKLTVNGNILCCLLIVLFFYDGFISSVLLNVPNTFSFVG